MKPKTSIITLGVTDFHKSLEFYHKGLGFPTHNYNDGDDHVLFSMDGTWLSLYPKEKLAQDAGVPNDSHGFAGITLAHNVSSKEAVDQVFQLAINAGAKLVKPPQNTFWGGYSGYFADPDGYLWEVAYNPFTDLT